MMIRIVRKEKKASNMKKIIKENKEYNKKNTKKTEKIEYNTGKEENRNIDRKGNEKVTGKAEKRIVPDTSILINGVLTDLVDNNSLENAEVILPEFVVEELRAQASRGREIGFKGLEEIKKIRELEKKGKIKLIKIGRRQTLEEIQLSKYGRIDALIIDIAKKKMAVLYTSDMVQSLVAEAEGVKTRYFEPYQKKKTILSKMLTKDTMSLHLKEGNIPLAKRGRPGSFKIVEISKNRMSRQNMEKIIKEIMDAAKYEQDSFVEVGGHNASVYQIGNMRIAVSRPPFSDAIEITVVRPIVKLTLEDYRLSDKLKKRLGSQIEGILIAGPPGSGKSTFAASLAEFYEEKGFIVKTMETPRDLQVCREITQYTKLKDSFENTSDFLLLVRPDYTVFDEIRKTNEFSIFADMRLAGIGMIGVVHATKPIDAVQRFVGRIELGILPHIVDTIIFINAGKIERVFCLSMTVRMPTGMQDADLARPVIEIRDFETNNLEYEMYTYGEETVILPVSESRENAIKNLAKKQVLAEIKKFDRNADANFINDNRIEIKVRNDVMPKIIGKKGKTIKMLEKRLGLKIEVSPNISMLGREISYEKEETGAYIVFLLNENPGRLASFYAGTEFIFSAMIGKNKQIKVAKKTDTGKAIMNAILKDNLKVFV